MAHLRLIMLCVLGYGFVNAGQLRRVNKVILSDLETDIQNQGISKLEFLEQLVDGIRQRSGKLGDFSEAGDVGLETCTDVFNTTQCSELLTVNCYNVTTLLKSIINTDDFNILDTFPALVYHMYQPRCELPEPEAVEGTEHGKNVPSAKAWGYGIGVCLIICFVSNIGGLMGPFMQKPYFQRLLLFCVALAVGTMASTGILVLMPESMLLTGRDSPVPSYKGKLAVLIAGIYGFYTMELLMKMCFDKRDKKAADRVANIDDEAKEQLNNGKELESQGHSHFPTVLKEKTGAGSGKKQVSTVAWTILMADSLHKFIDGISIGASFTTSVPLGVSVSLSIICEELPHELGDIAILLHAGLSMKRALLYNFLAALFSLIGLACGIVVGENTNASLWILAVAGGMFIYVSLVDMLPEMREQANKAIGMQAETPFTVFIIQNLGLIAGFCIISALVFFYNI